MQTLIQMYDSRQFSTSEIAGKLGVSAPTVYNQLRRLGLSTTVLKRRYKAGKKFDFSETEKTRIRLLAEEGRKVTEIALALNRPMSLGPVRRICRELGITASVAKSLTAAERFGALMVLEPAASLKTYKGHFESRSLVKCDCGKSLTVFNSALRAKNTSSCGCRIQRKNPESVWIRIRCQIESGARQRGLEMRLNNAQLKHICLLHCAYCNAPPSNEMKGRKSGKSTAQKIQLYSGIDRVSALEGYVLGNVLPCCLLCNRAKSDADLKIFVGWLERLGSTRTVSGILEALTRLTAELDALRPRTIN